MTDPVPGPAIEFRPPVPAIPADHPSFLRFLSAARTNALQIWPAAAYEEPALVHRSLGRTRVLMNAAEGIARVLLDNPANYRRSPASIRILRPIVGNGLLLSEGEAWRHQRRTIAPRMLPVLSRHIADSATRAAARLGSALGAPVDLLRVMQELALDVAGRSMFSLETADHQAAMRGLLTHYAEKLARPHLLDMILPPHLTSPRDLARRRFSTEWMGLIERMMAPRLAEPEAAVPRDLFDLLRAARDPETGAAFDRAALRDQTATMIAAGHETTGVTLFWALYLLANAPGAQDWVAAEVAEADLSPEAVGTTLPLLVRTRSVVQEALRLYPAAATLIRQAVGPDEVAGVRIPKGALVFISPWVLHRHAALWRQPHDFVADRFLGAAPERFAYLPFGAGPRVCVGAQFALAEATIILAAMIQAFTVRMADARPVLPVSVVTTQPDAAPGFFLAPRTASAPRHARPDR